MHPLFTFYAWKCFFARLAKVFFPTTILFFICSLKYIKKFNNNSQTRFFLIAFLCLFGMRWAIYFGGTDFNNRYLLPALIPIIIFCSFGYRYLYIISYKKIKKKHKYLKRKHYFMIFSVLFAIVSIGKVWHKKREKPYIKSIGYFIKENAKKSQKEIIVINNLHDQRFLYYANAESARFSLNKLKEQINKLKKQNKNIYIFLKNKQKEIAILQKSCKFQILKIFKYKNDNYQLFVIND